MADRTKATDIAESSGLHPSLMRNLIHARPTKVISDHVNNKIAAVTNPAEVNISSAIDTYDATIWSLKVRKTFNEGTGGKCHVPGLVDYGCLDDIWLV
jgi:hypothetical protein